MSPLSVAHGPADRQRGARCSRRSFAAHNFPRLVGFGVGCMKNLKLIKLILSLEQNMSSTAAPPGAHKSRDRGIAGAPRRSSRQSASRKLSRTEQVGFKVPPEHLAEIKTACWRDGQSQADWLASAVAAVLKRGVSPVEIAASPDVEQVREGLVVLGNVRSALEFALAEFAHPRVTTRRRAQARELLVYAGQLLKVVGKRLTP
jgi:hypothetical protein